MLTFFTKTEIFKGKLTALTDINELPQKSIVHITFSEDSSSISSTVVLSDVSSPERLSRWPPGPFPIPTFSFDVELMLRNGNVEYEKNNTLLNITRDMKHNILDNLASTIYGFKAYPNDMEIAMAAKVLVAKHPCLTEAGSETWWNGWKNSIRFKMGNYRNKMRRAGCREVAVNAGKRSKSHPERESSHSNIKRPKRAEVNFLPNFPEGKNESHLEKLRQMIVDECQKTEKDLSFIRKLMEATFPLRRQTVVVSCPPVNEIMDLWPALKMESEESHDVHSRRTTALQALPLCLHDVAELFRTCTCKGETTPERPCVTATAVQAVCISHLFDLRAYNQQPSEEEEKRRKEERDRVGDLTVTWRMTDPKEHYEQQEQSVDEHTPPFFSAKVEYLLNLVCSVRECTENTLIVKVQYACMRKLYLCIAQASTIATGLHLECVEGGVVQTDARSYHSKTSKGQIFRRNRRQLLDTQDNKQAPDVQQLEISEKDLITGQQEPRVRQYHSGPGWEPCLRTRDDCAIKPRQVLDL
ncbi:hypothetical protein D9C73_020333 [Collichthys lucidus]|uniref:Sterile alpha motif domain-containing protein 3 n=1 Tax=Collichthys lucidus TaxID=240159 RepID=A0A4U5VDZ9_COLLU|nr:hypothetical protein D9C73_020333 [Collichthys lucidus]